MNSEHAETFIVNLLRQGLAPTLTYHGLHHTLDVAKATAQLAKKEGVTDPDALDLLHTAALFHDAGFLTTYDEHEAAGCELVRQTLPKFAYSTEQIEAICGMIAATKIPQDPKTHLEQILCDADLDYLGRPDFIPIAATLFSELAMHRGLTNEQVWNQLQVSFLEKHHYWTVSATHWRETNKQTHLSALRILTGIAPVK